MIVCVSGWCVVAGLVLVGMWLVSDMSQPPECKVRGRRGVLSCACAWVWVCINQWNAEERRGTQEDEEGIPLCVRVCACVRVVLVCKSLSPSISRSLTLTITPLTLTPPPPPLLTQMNNRTTQLALNLTFHCPTAMVAPELWIVGVIMSGGVLGCWVLVIGLPWCLDSTSLGHSSW